MSTSSPIRKVYDVPIEKPAKPRENPLSLPAPEPDRWFAPMPRMPVREPARRK